MKITKIKIISILVLFIVIFFIGLDNNRKQLRDRKYTFRSLFEVPISTNTHDTLLSIYHSNFKYNKDYYIITNTPFSESNYIPAPSLMLIDPDTNYYISNAYENIKIFDKNGNFISKFEYPDGFGITNSSLDEKGNILISISSMDPQEKKKLLYEINVKEHVERILSDDEIRKLSPALLEPRTESEYLQRKKNEQGMNGFYFDVKWGGNMVKTIFTNNEGRFISLNSLHVYKIDMSYDEISLDNIPKEYEFDDLSISKYNSDKVFDVSSTKVDKRGNIFISGVRSNEIERTTLRYSGKDVEAIKVYRPKFFLWEFERKQ